MRKSFTLIETLVSVAIFATVSVIVISLFAISVSSKSKAKAINNLRNEGSRIMSEVQNMIERGNVSGVGYNGLAGVDGNTGNTTSSTCVYAGTQGIFSDYKDAQGNETFEKIFYASNSYPDTAYRSKLVIWKKMVDSTGNVKEQQSVLVSDDIEKVQTFTVYGVTTTASCGNLSPYFIVTLRLRGKTRGYTGGNVTDAAGSYNEMTLVSRFTPKYPNPNKAGDSI